MISRSPVSSPMMAKLKQLFSRLAKRERIILYVTVIFVFFGLMDGLVYKPIMRHFNELEEKIISQENELRKNIRYLAAREIILNRYSAYAAHAVTSGGDEEEIASLLNEIEELARKSGLSLVNMKPKPATTTEFGKQYPLEVEMETQMAQLIKFIHGLHSSKYILGVKKLRLVPKGKQSAQVKGYLVINKTVIH